MSSSWPLSFSCGNWSVAFVFPFVDVCAVGPFCFRVKLLVVNFVGDADIVSLVQLWSLFWSVSPPSSWLIKAVVVEEIESLWLVILFVVEEIDSFWLVKSFVVEEIDSFWLFKSCVVEEIKSFWPLRFGFCWFRTVVEMCGWTGELRSVPSVCAVSALLCRGSSCLRGFVSSLLVVAIVVLFVGLG